MKPLILGVKYAREVSILPILSGVKDVAQCAGIGFVIVISYKI